MRKALAMRYFITKRNAETLASIPQMPDEKAEVKRKDMSWRGVLHNPTAAKHELNVQKVKSAKSAKKIQKKTCNSEIVCYNDKA